LPSDTHAALQQHGHEEPRVPFEKAELSAQKMSLDYPLCASQAAFSIVT
jgi:hypothetical protein